MSNSSAHLCVTRDTLITPQSLWNVRWVTQDDHKAFIEPFRKDQEYGWTLDEFRDLQNQGYRYCGIFVGDRLCSLAGLWKRETDVWEVIAVGTRDEYRHQGMGSSVVHFVADHILQQINVASYTANIKNTASISTAQSVGFQYCVNLINGEKWCASGPRSNECNMKCSLFSSTKSD